MKIGTAQINTILLTLALLVQATLLYRHFVDRPSPPTPTRQAPKDAVIDIGGMPVLGSEQATAILVEFSDFQCPFCRRHATEVLPALIAKYVESGNVRYVFANNPLDNHPYARVMARAAICANRQGRFWLLHSALFQLRPSSADDIPALAHKQNVDRQVFDQCFSMDPAATARIEADTALARRLGLRSTPSFAVGTAAADGRVQIKSFVIGAQAMDVFESALRSVL